MTETLLEVKPERLHRYNLEIVSRVDDNEIVLDLIVNPKDYSEEHPFYFVFKDKRTSGLLSQDNVSSRLYLRVPFNEITINLLKILNSHKRMIGLVGGYDYNKAMLVYNLVLYHTLYHPLRNK